LMSDSILKVNECEFTIKLELDLLFLKYN